MVRGQHLQHAPRTTWPPRSRKASTAAGLVGMRFNTIGVSDGISMGTEGMSYSLQSRDLIADSIETVMRAQWYDANISHPRLRQEHARLPDRDGPAQPARRSWSTAARSAPAARRRRPEARHRLGVSSATANSSPARSTEDERAGDRPPQPVPAPAPAAACTRPTRWPRRSKRWACRCPTARRSRPKIPRKLDECLGAGRGDSQSAGTRHQAARHHDARGVRERDGRW